MMDVNDIKKIFSDANAIIDNDHFVYAKKPDGWYHGQAYVNKDAVYPFTRYISPLCAEIARRFNFSLLPGDVEVVIGPTVGAVSLSQWTAHHLAPFAYQQEILSVYADEEDVFEEYTLLFDAFKALLKHDFKSGIILTGVAAGEHSVVGAKPDDPMVKLIESVSFKIKVGTRRILKRGYDKIVKDKKCIVVEDVINSGATVIKTIQTVREAGGIVVGVGALCNRSGGKVTKETLEVPILESLLDVKMDMSPEDECPICKEKGFESVRTDLGKGKEFLMRKGLITA